MQYVELRLGQLFIDPTNYRGDYEAIGSLAESINKHGLLQNLVVAPTEDEGLYVVKSGNRRLLAIHKLAESERWPEDEPIMCLVVDDDPWIPIAENNDRADVPPWNTGFRYLELQEAGYTMQQIAANLHVSIGTVSNYVSIARGLHPKIMEKIKRIGHKSLTKGQFIAISKQLDEFYEPHYPNQNRMLSKFLDHTPPKTSLRKKARKPQTHPERVYERLRKILNGSIVIPAHAAAFILPLLSYLNGDAKRLNIPPAPKDQIDE